VTFNPNDHVLVRSNLPGQLLKKWMRSSQELSAGEIHKLHGSIQLDVAIRYLKAPRHNIRATITILEAIESLSLLGALVIFIQHTIGIVIRIWAAISILKAIDVLRLGPALVIPIEHTVRVIVWFRTTVRILKLIVILEGIRTTVVCSCEAIPIAVRTGIHLGVTHQNPADRAFLRRLDHLGAQGQPLRYVLTCTRSVALALLQDGESVGGMHLSIELW